MRVSPSLVPVAESGILALQGGECQWVNFATHCDPNSEELPEWPAYSERPEGVMVLGADAGPRAMPEAEKRAFFEAALSSEATQ